MRCPKGLCLWSLCLILCLAGTAASWGEPVYLVSQTDTPGYAKAVAVANRLAYIADGTTGLKIFDVSEPSRPVLKGTFTVKSQSVVNVTVNGTLAYANASNYYEGHQVLGGGTYVLDVKNPAAPRQLSYIKSSGSLGDIGCAVSGSRLFITSTGGNEGEFFCGLSMVDLTNPSAPVLKDTYPLGRDGGGMSLSGNFAAVSHGESGVKILIPPRPPACACMAFSPVPMSVMSTSWARPWSLA